MKSLRSKRGGSTSTANTKGYSNPELLISPAELAEQLGIHDGGALNPDAAPLILDLRPAEDYARGQIPMAIHLDLFGLSLVDTDPAPLRAFMWMIEHVLASRGVTRDWPVVVYDEHSGMRAARAFWFLEYFGHRDVRLLDGGFGAWTKAGFEVSHEAPPPMGSDWTGERRDERIATWQDVRDRLNDPETVLLDTRSDGEYAGTTVRAARGGSIPGAVHIEWKRNLEDNGEFKPAGDLRAMYERAGVTPDREVITYCQGGYRAAHSYLALRLLGYPRIRNYVGSWKEWGDRVDLPVEKPER
jgi:thiosulfate/3-mercaptopyruvate sulfurtransferase